MNDQAAKSRSPQYTIYFIDVCKSVRIVCKPYLYGNSIVFIKVYTMIYIPCDVLLSSLQHFYMTSIVSLLSIPGD